MKIKIILAAAILVLALPVFAEFKAIEDGYELFLGDVRLPRIERGTLTFKPCDGCDYQTKRVAKSVQWLINGKAVSLRKFRERAELQNPDELPVTISRDIKSDRIVWISIHIRDAG